MGLVKDGGAKIFVERYVYAGAVEDKIVGRQGVIAEDFALFGGARSGRVADVT